MVLRRPYISKRTRGVTFVEVLVVIALLLVLATTFVPVGVGYIHTYALTTERDTLVSLLISARNRAQANSHTPYSVYADSSRYVLFPGSTYHEHSDLNEITLVHSGITLMPSGVVITFAPLSGDSQEKIIIFQNVGHAVSAKINSEGIIE